MASSSSATSPEDEIVNQKSARIKQWVKNRMKEVSLVVVYNVQSDKWNGTVHLRSTDANSDTI